MFSPCLQNCGSQLSLLQPSQSSHLGKSPKMISLRTLGKKSLKSIKSQKSIRASGNQFEDSHSSRVSLRMTNHNDKNTSISHDLHPSIDCFRNPFDSFYREQTHHANGMAHHGSCKQLPESPSSLKIRFHFQDSFDFRIDNHQFYSDQEETRAQRFQDSQQEYAVQLSEIPEEKDDLMSTHFGGEHHGLDVHWPKPKSAVSMMSSRSQCNSVIMEMPYKADKLTKLF